MDIKIDNISFKAIEFKNQHARNVFNKKLKSCSAEGVKDVLDFIEKQITIKNKAIIDVTNETHNYSDEVMFATFPHDRNAIAVNKRGAASVMDFLNRCAAITGYEGEMLTVKPKHVAKKVNKKESKFIGQVF